MWGWEQEAGAFRARHVRMANQTGEITRFGTLPQDDPVYLFMNKKRAEGKPYLVYITAGANKFLRIYYGRVKEYLAKLEQPAEPSPETPA